MFLNLKNKTFWSILVGINCTTLIMCAVSGSWEGVIFSSIALVCSYYMIYIQDDD